MEIRIANINDLPQVESLMSIPEFKDSDGWSPDVEYLKNYLEDNLFLVTSDNDKIIGAIYGEKLKGNGVLLWYIVVDSKNQGEGIGKKLMGTFENLCKDRGFEWINLNSPIENANNIKFYKKCGFNQEKSYIEFYKDI